jgi:hypothetical protein
MRALCLLAALLLMVLSLSQATCEVKPLVIVACFDGQPYPPEYCPNYSQAILGLATEAVRETYGSEIEVRTIGDWFFLLDVLSLPNVIGGLVSLREGQFRLSDMRQEAFVASFERGLGLVGINYMGQHSSMGRVAEAVFPLNATKAGSGKIVREAVVTAQHTHVKLVDNPVTENSPETMDIPDASVVYHHPVPSEGWWTPAAGEMTVLYACTTADRDAQVPSIVLYEREGGRSVTFAGLRCTDATGLYERDIGWFNHSFSRPEVRQLLRDALVYVLEPYASAEPLNSRMEEIKVFVEEKLRSLRIEVDAAEESLGRQRRESAMLTAIVLVLSCLAAAGIVYVGFLRG